MLINRCVSLLCLFFSIPLFANPTAVDIEKIAYYKVSPDIISNLDIDASNHNLTMYTLMLRITLMTNSQKDIEEITFHKALFRDSIILFINKNRKNNLQTIRQKQQFRRTLRRIINRKLEEKLHKPNIIKKVLITQMIID